MFLFIKQKTNKIVYFKPCRAHDNLDFFLPKNLIPTNSEPSLFSDCGPCTLYTKDIEAFLGEKA